VFAPHGLFVRRQVLPMFAEMNGEIVENTDAEQDGKETVIDG